MFSEEVNLESNLKTTVMYLSLGLLLYKLLLFAVTQPKVDSVLVYLFEMTVKVNRKNHNQVVYFSFGALSFQSLPLSF